MVGTRKSLGAVDSNASSAAFVLPASTGDKKKDRLLRELYIDAAEGLRGEKKAESKQSIDQGKGVYTWRGAVYAITDDTPQEWIDAEAGRHKKKEKEVVPQAPASMPRKRRLEDDEETRPAKKVRRSMPDMTSRKQREAAGTWPRKKLSSLGRQRETGREISEEPRPKTDIEIRKEMAKEQGWEVEMLPEIKVKSKPKPKKKAASKITKQKKKQAEPEQMPFLERLSGKIEARQLAFDVAKMARLNTRIADVSEQIETAEDQDGKLDKLKEILRAPMSTNEEAHENEQSVQQRTPDTEQSPEIPKATTEANERTHKVSSSNTTPSLTTDDTAASTLSPGPPTLVPRSSPEIPNMEDKNRGGNSLRWSLDKSSILKNPGRAENAIQKSRLEGESNKLTGLLTTTLSMLRLVCSAVLEILELRRSERLFYSRQAYTFEFVSPWNCGLRTEERTTVENAGGTGAFPVTIIANVTEQILKGADAVGALPDLNDQLQKRGYTVMEVAAPPKKSTKKGTSKNPKKRVKEESDDDLDEDLRPPPLQTNTFGRNPATFGRKLRAEPV
ncbi:uncharacterized protein MYCFIDRAFT_198769 [Pseudocercospora fijiensis CIRAD86]|uniref:Uncharacterized protein n=1 Tax=Pseudocercospora fijiensis (strain CIRAD86) TaxID=383855 RepID=M3ASW4_PSEFD|nr:uncharacterized protein MYCFIDRAFT_198769 [Pseudocercospora fijiensis CIRAD86]EME80582.1 hypothetical protein MYCFIDRAFT_198769 [Pseudocercospora fijiensis CIRAD86]